MFRIGRYVDLNKASKDSVSGLKGSRCRYSNNNLGNLKHLLFNFKYVSSALECPHVHMGAPVGGQILYMFVPVDLKMLRQSCMWKRNSCPGVVHLNARVFKITTFKYLDLHR